MFQINTRHLNNRIATLLIASSGALFAQTSAVGHVAGKVTHPDGTPAANQLVQVVTPRGNRELRTDAKGQFLVANLVPGKVVVRIDARDMMEFRSEILVMVNQTATLNIHLRPQAGQVVTVVDVDASLPLNTTDQALAKTGFTTTMEQVDNLPIPLTTSSDRLNTILTLVPGSVLGSAFHGGSTMAYHVDGVDTTDSNWGGNGTNLNNDLIDQVQILTGGISAKYGRFDAGLVSVTTKSGTNAFEGSVRLALSNPKWGGVGKTPEIYKAMGMDMSRPMDATTTIQSYTFLGPILKDRLFFSLGYQTYSPAQRTQLSTSGLGFGSVPYVATTSETRKDMKLDWIINESNRLSAQYNAVKAESTNQFTNFGKPTSLATLSGLARTEKGYYSLAWTTQLASNLLLDLKFNDAFRKEGGSGTGATGGDSVATWRDVPDYLLFDNGDCSNAKEDRHQKVYSAGVTWFGNGMGEHQIDAGVQSYTYTMESAALDFPSGFLINFNGFIPGAASPALANRILEVANPALTSLVWQQPVAGKATTRNQSVYLNDTWTVDKHISLNLGLRYDKFTSDTVPENNHYSTDALAPRLAFTYDLHGDKADIVTFSAAVYAAQILQGNLANASVTKTPITQTYAYLGTGGPAQGTGADALASTGAINWAAWGNYAGARGQNNPVSISDPIKNRTTFVDPNLKAPRTRELTLGYRHEVARQSFTATLIRRWMDRFVDDIWYGNGISNGVAKILIANDPDGWEDYYALEMTYRNNLSEHVSFGGNFTWSRTLTNTESQANNFGSGITRDRLAPAGPTNMDRPFILHADATYRNTVGKGTYNVSLLGSFFGKESARYRWGTAVTPTALVNQGYAATYRKYFPELGPLHQPEHYTLDLQVGLDYPIAGKARVFGKINIMNVLNYMPNYSNTYYGTAYTGTYTPYALVDGMGTMNVNPRTLNLDFGLRF